MRKTLFLAAAVALTLGVSAVAAQSVQLFSKAGEKFIRGQRVIVHITVAVPPGQDGNQIADAALERRGARPLEAAEFSTTGLVWDNFFDADGGNDLVPQYYNPAGDPFGGGALTALQNTHSTWTGVPTSGFQFSYAGATNRCPSLVDECPDAQFFDGFNDVAWIALAGPNVLGVTWFGTSIDEADMALNTAFTWQMDGGNFDIETVFLHENGHALGLGHSNVSGAVMEPTYAGLRRGLHSDDAQGVTTLYPAPGGTDSISGAVFDAVTLAPISGATVSIESLSLSAKTDSNGDYVLDGVPATGSVDVTANAKKFSSVTHSADAGWSGVNFDLSSTGGGKGKNGGGGDGGGPGGGKCHPVRGC